MRFALDEMLYLLSLEMPDRRSTQTGNLVPEPTDAARKAT